MPIFKRQSKDQKSAVLREGTRRDFYRNISDEGWSQIATSATKRERSQSDIEKNLKHCFEAWCVNPIAKSYCDYMRFFVIGKGTMIECEEEEDRDRLETFLKANDWPILEKQICEELSRDGEVFIRLHSNSSAGGDVRELGGSALMSIIDPLEIK